MLAFLVGVVRFALLARMPARVEDVPLWALTMPYRLWRRRVRYDGKTFADLYGGNVDPIARFLLPMRLFYLFFLLSLPLLFALRGLGHGRSAWRYYRHALKRPDLAVSHKEALYTEAEIAWSRPDYALAMAYAFLYARAPAPYFALDDKRHFVAACRAAGLPLPLTLSVDEAIAKGGVFVVKEPTKDLGYGVRLRTADELAERRVRAAGWVIQERLANHRHLAAVIGDDAPLCSLRVITLRDPSSGAFGIVRAAIRLGRAGSVVDNTQQGGIWANLEAASGKIRAGVTKRSFGHWRNGAPIRCFEHPDTHNTFVGVRVPWWDEGRALALLAHERLAPDAPTLGWDIALAEVAPVLLEVNVWTTCYDYDPESDAFTPSCRAVLACVA